VKQKYTTGFENTEDLTKDRFWLGEVFDHHVCGDYVKAVGMEREMVGGGACGQAAGVLAKARKPGVSAENNGLIKNRRRPTEVLIGPQPAHQKLFSATDVKNARLRPNEAF
jgi:hypothetical protein